VSPYSRDFLLRPVHLKDTFCKIPIQMAESVIAAGMNTSTRSFPISLKIRLSFCTATLNFFFSSRSKARAKIASNPSQIRLAKIEFTNFVSMHAITL